MIYCRTRTCFCHPLWSSSIPTTFHFHSAPRFMCGAPLTHQSHSTGGIQTFPVFHRIVFHIPHSASVHFDFHDPLLFPQSDLPFHDPSCLSGFRIFVPQFAFFVFYHLFSHNLIRFRFR